MTDAEIKRLLRVCIDINKLSIDQSRLFVAAEYVPLPKQAEFHRACRECDGGIVTDVLQGGGRGGGKTSAAVAQAVFDDMTRFSGLKALFLRSVVKAAKESFDDKVNKMIKIPHDRTGDRVTLPNGSFILFGGFGDRNDITKYQGNEYDLIIVEEATFFKELTIDMINGSLRSTRSDGWKPRMYLTANPGGIGHKWVKGRFVDPYYGNREEETRYIHSTYKDNSLLDANYIKKLEGYSGNLRKSWTLGDWNLDEGIAFAFDEDIHVINDMQLWEHSQAWGGIYPEHQTVGAVRLPLRGIDDGFRAPYAALWGMYNPLIPRVIVYREDYGVGYTNAEQAERIKSLTPPHEAAFPWMTYADPAMFGKKSLDTITSPSDIYADHGVYLTRGDNQRSHGKRKVDSLLQIKGDGLPGLLVHKSCANLINQFNSLIYDENKLEDVDTDQEDHAYDALRYLLSGVRDKTEAEPIKTPVRNPLMDLFPS